ncbi:MAG TPA: NPCBM/NEW2 domain-containing protein, partial [Tepidisphaeraceae bacterium]
RVNLMALDHDSISLSSSGKNQQIPIDQLLRLERTDKPVAIASKFIAMLSGGDRAAGLPRAIQGDNLIWENPTLGELSLPLRSVVAIVRSGDEISPASGTEDVVTLSNNDTVHGIITAVSGAAISLQQSGGDVTSVPLDSIARIVFASTAAAARKQARGFRITLADQTAITASKVQLDGEKISATLLDGTNRSLPAVMIVAIEQINGPVAWLSSLVPSENVQTPFLDVSWPTRFDRAVDGEPIRFGDKIFAHGIGVHSYSRLSFAIEPSWHSFRTQFAIAGNLPYANVTARIKLDQSVAYEKANFRSGVLALPVNIPLDGHHQLTLEVDYGENDDVQDRFNWIEPAFLTAAATTEPTN